MKYVCELCGMTYDETVGDIRAGIQPGTKFEQLPADYACSGCGYLKETFNPVGAAPAKKDSSAYYNDSNR